MKRDLFAFWKLFLSVLILFEMQISCVAQKDKTNQLLVGAEQPEKYLPLIDGKKVGLIVNQTSMVDSIHIIDFLIKKKVDVRKIFAAEHGVRGVADAGEIINDEVDARTGIPIVSLYGKNKRPNAEQFADIDILIFDIQDVGCRFYTYISTMHYLMDAAAEYKKEVLVFDRPNPNGDYVAGAVLDSSLQSFVGMHPIPIVHGCTVGELAQMINGENWLPFGSCQLRVIPVRNYTHNTRYKLPIKPSPNLPTDRSIRLYPSLCLFEATTVSIGRGTYFPFQVIGYPDSLMGEFTFTPISIEGMSKDPIHKNIQCFGEDLRESTNYDSFSLEPFLRVFSTMHSETDFWKSRRWIDLLTGDPLFYDAIIGGATSHEILNRWQPAIDQYLTIREKYLLYPDFTTP